VYTEIKKAGVNGRKKEKRMNKVRNDAKKEESYKEEKEVIKPKEGRNQDRRLPTVTCNFKTV
jgi:hypothetical protein